MNKKSTPLVTPAIILASSSSHRRSLMDRLQLTYSAISPDIDESPMINEPIETMVARLSLAKAEAVANEHPQSVVIGSDQVACVDDTILTKPGNFEHARQQLRQQSGKLVTFYTGLAVVGSGNEQQLTDIVTTHVQFRSLSDDDISTYLLADKPYDCAGSFKSEGLGISLFDSIESEDPTALVGLPLIRLCQFLRRLGVLNPSA